MIKIFTFLAGLIILPFLLLSAAILIYPGGETPPKNCNVTSSLYSADFVGHLISLPASMMDECTLWGEDDGYGGELPARIAMTLTLPKLNAKNADQKTFPLQKDDIRIWIGGLSSETRLQKSPTSPPDKFTGFEKRIALESYGNGHNSKHFRYNDIKFFEKLPDEEYGLTHYRKIDAGRYHSAYEGQDVYVHALNAEKDAFILNCNVRYSICGCTSNSKWIRANVGYHYCYSQDHLSKAILIDQKVEETVGSFFSNSRNQ